MFTKDFTIPEDSEIPKVGGNMYAIAEQLLFANKLKLIELRMKKREMDASCINVHLEKSL